MKKLLLYLMTLLVFGAVPVDSFGAEYLKIVSAKSNFDTSSSGDVAVSVKGAAKENVVLGNGKFAIGVRNTDGSSQVITWYKILGSGSGVSELVPNTTYNLEAIYPSTSTTGFSETRHALMKMADDQVGSDEAFTVSFDNRNYTLTVYADYSKNQVNYQSQRNNWADQSLFLNRAGSQTFDVNTGSDTKIKLWLTDGSGRNLAYNIGTINASEWNSDKVYKKTVSNFVTKTDSNCEIGGLKPRQNYRITVSYVRKDITITQLPASLYLRGDAAGGNWHSLSNWQNDDWMLVEQDGEYTGTFKLKAGWFSLQFGEMSSYAGQGTNDEQTAKATQYGIGSGALNGRNVEGEQLHADGWSFQVTGSSRYFFFRVTVDEDGFPDKVWITEVPESADTDYTGYRLTTYYGDQTKNTQHTTSRVEKVMEGEGDDAYWNGQWMTIDNGDGDPHADNDGYVIYDGLRLGYDKFCLLGHNPATGATRWYGYDGDGGIKVGETYTFKVFNTANSKTDAMAKTFLVSDEVNKVNSRYDIYWNWTTKQFRVEFNEEWMNHENAMYLYKLDADADGNLSEDYRTLTLDKVLEELNKDGQNKVYKFELAGDGMYTYNFKDDEAQDLPMNTRFCLVGRTGQVYNIATSDFEPYEIGDQWYEGNKNFRLEMTRSDAQKAAWVKTDQLADMNCVATIRANFTSSADGLKNAYAISFMQEDPAPTKFTIRKEGESTTHDIVSNGDGTYTLVGLSLENQKKYYVTAEFINGESKDYGPVNTTTVSSNGFDGDIDIVGNNGSTTDYSNYKVCVRGDKIGWGNTNYSTPNAAGYVVMNNVWIGNGNFKIFFNNGEENWRSNGQTISLGSPVTLTYNDNTNMKVDGASENDKFNVMFNVATGELTISKNELSAPAPSTPSVGGNGKEYFQINSTVFDLTSRINIQWNNGSPKMQIARFGDDKQVTVYFIDRAGWVKQYGGNINVYNWSDQGLTTPKDVNSAWGESVDINHGYPGVPMSLVAEGDSDYGLRTKLNLANDVPLYKLQLSVMEYEGLYSRPKVQFNNYNNDGNYKKKTYNLYLVDGGIYTNASPERQVTNEQGHTVTVVDYPATVYLPRMQYNYMDDEQDRDVLAYPNEFHDTDYNYIYLDDPILLAWAKEEGHNVGVNIRYDRDNDGYAEFTATGITGQHYMYVQKVGNHEYLRVALAEDVIPNHQENVEITFWCIEWSGHKEHEMSFTGESGKHDSSSLSTNCTYDGVDYTGEHLACENSHCSLIFKNVEYADGYVYRRYHAADGTPQKPITTIGELENPKALHIVTSVISEFAGAQTKGVLATSAQTVAGIENCYQLLRRDENEGEKIVYSLPEVGSGAEFYVLAEYDGNVAVKYSGTEDKRLLPGVPEMMFDGFGKNYSINTDVTNYVKNYEIVISWTDATVTVNANKIDADFQFLGYDDNGDLVSMYNHGFLLPAHSDGCLKHAEGVHLTPIFFEYAAGYDMKNEKYNYDRLKNLAISLVRDQAYEKYFSSDPEDPNKPARIIKNGEFNGFEPDSKDPYSGYQNYVQVGGDEGCLTVVRPSTYISDKNAGNKKGIARIYIMGYTAGLVSLKIEQTEQDPDYRRSAETVPIRIYPTFESIGLSINNLVINNEIEYELEDGSTKKITPFQQQDGVYTVNLSHENHNDGDVQFKDRLHFQATAANQKYVTYHWCYNSDKNSAKRRLTGSSSSSIESVVTNPAYSKSVLVSDVNKNPFTDEAMAAKGVNVSDYSIYNAPRVAIDSTGQATNSTGVYLQLKQNGIASPAYQLDVNRTADIPTEVEEIPVEGVEEVAPVYYNLNGVRVDAERLEPGIYVKVTGNTSEKVYVK